jgi:hypothetical protein
MIRDFMDADGVTWRVWSTVPTVATTERSRVEAWLTFESGGMRRRLSPIPEGWEYASTSALAAFCARATVVPAGQWATPP